MSSQNPGVSYCEEEPDLVDLASSRYGGEVVWCSDEFFAASANLVAPSAPVWREEEFTDHGKWMDGWETRRRRDQGHDSCIIRLGLPGIVNRVTVDTSHFTGNYPESFSLDACGVPTERLDEAEWVEVLPRTRLEGDRVAVFEVGETHRATHVRLNIYPDGGVARLRVDGEPIPAMDQVCPDEGLIDLARATLGAVCTEASDAHFSSPANLISPTDPEGMWDGWETARRRGPGHDWAIVDLGLPGTVHRFEVDTRHFKGNAPGWVDLDVARHGADWTPACQRVSVEAHSVNRIDLAQPVEADRVRLNIHPDGGVARLRVWGRPIPASAARLRIRYLDSLFDQEAASFFSTACASGAWVERMMDLRPFGEAAAVLDAADRAFEGLSGDDWLEAFAAHPRIGDRAGRQSRAGEAMSRHEQAGVDPNDAGELDDMNRRYEDKFGFTYIVRAAGRSGQEMLELARQRLDNDRHTEIEVAAGQQREITMLRLRRMLCLSQEET
ncbi:MAG TPA: allantoicase [Acidimicrobiia bacterium]|nr:allantoicase [Acidimicrobiia bacterium]